MGSEFGGFVRVWGLIVQLQTHTAGPLIPVHSVSFHNIGEEKHLISSPGDCIYMSSLHILSMSVWVFSSHPSFLPHPRSVHIRWIGVSQLPQSEWVLVWCARPRKGILSWVGAQFIPVSCWENLWPPATLNWNKQVGKEWSCLLLLILLKCIDSLHLFQCLILEVFRGLLELSWCFCDQKYAVGT